ncbi:unnamed protein product [Echinostoma caproni]|uniref:AAA domain-containing protein n=1 Tax=Echinostoma caproni TaxID=27848 RepID=A0A183AR12_9TREM|nr:unnamed protein product [Echinostoma caproni]
MKDFLVTSGESPADSSLEAIKPTSASLVLNGGLPFSSLGLQPTERLVHVEVCLQPFCVESSSVVESHVVQFIRELGPRQIPTMLNNCENFCSMVTSQAIDPQTIECLQTCVNNINILLNESDVKDGFDASRSVDLRTATLVVHVFQMVTGDEALPVQEILEFGSETVNAGTVWLLPSMAMHGLWESLIFDTDIKSDLLEYAQTALLFAEKQIAASIIAWNRVVLLYGPPGTGKTSLCHALANKLAILARMFDAIKEYLDSSDHLVCLLVDEVESLTAMRNTAMSGVEPSDAIRVVNAVLTQIDQIKRFPNVLILATSNVTGVIDPAFLDRADVRLYIGPPSAPAIYTIYRSCLAELIRVGLIQDENNLLSYQALATMQFTENKINATSIYLWKLAQRSVGLNGRTLRKLPLLAHAFHLKKVSPRTHSSSFGARVHSASTEQRTDRSPLKSISPENTTQLTPNGHVSLQTFMQALLRAVDAQFADMKSLEKASNLTRLLEHHAMKS